MPRRSRSGSDVSISSDSSASSFEISASTSKLPASRNLSGISYKPPKGFDAIQFSKSSVLTEKSLLGSQGKEAWALRIPAGISPSHLEGLVIKLPSKDLDSYDSSIPLASLKAPTTTSAVSNKYNLYASKPDSKGKGKNGKVPTTESQLISMAAAGSSNPSNPNKSHGSEGSANIAAGQGAAAELASLKLLVPAGDGSQPGKLVMAPLKISRCLHLSVVSPASTGIASTKKEATGVSLVAAKTKRQQPWELLTGSFRPAGTRNDKPSSLEGESKKRKNDKKQHTDQKSPRKVKKEEAS